MEYQADVYESEKSCQDKEIEKAAKHCQKTKSQVAAFRYRC